MAALRAVSTTSWVCRHIAKISFIAYLLRALLLQAESFQLPITHHPQRYAPGQEQREHREDQHVPAAQGDVQKERASRPCAEPLGLQRHGEHVGGAYRGDEDGYEERDVLADAADDVPGVEVEAAGPLGLADGKAGGDYGWDEPQGGRDGEGEAVGYPQPDEAYRHLLVAGRGKEDHAGYDRGVQAQRDADPVDERLPLHEEEERGLAAAEDGPEDDAHDGDGDQDEPDAPEVGQGPRQVAEEQDYREHAQQVEGVSEHERQHERPDEQEHLGPRIEAVYERVPVEIE